MLAISSELMWFEVRGRINCPDCISYCEGHFQCLLKQRAYDLSRSPLAVKSANDVLCTRLLTLSPLAKVWMVISLRALTCDFTHTHTHIIGTHTIGLGDLWPLSLLCCHLTRIDFLSSSPSAPFSSSQCFSSLALSLASLPLSSTLFLSPSSLAFSVCSLPLSLCIHLSLSCHEIFSISIIKSHNELWRRSIGFCFSDCW